jgi:hypothetical protein
VRMVFGSSARTEAERVLVERTPGKTELGLSTRNKRKHKVSVQRLVMSAALLIVSMVELSCTHSSDQNEITNCQRQLRSIGSVIMLYCEDHEERLPANFRQLASESGMSNGVARLLVCPEQSNTRTVRLSSPIMFIWTGLHGFRPTQFQPITRLFTIEQRKTMTVQE